MKVIIGESPVTFRRKTYAPGDKVDLPDNIAKSLISAGACETPGKETEVRDQKSEVRGQRSEIGSQKTATANRNSLPVKELKNVNKKMSDSG